MKNKNEKSNKGTKSEKRHYTKRGTTILGKRVVLVDGIPAGRGRPSAEGKGKRTVVYIPMGETYDAAKHGLGKQFRPDQHPVIRRLKVENATVDLAETPAVATAPETSNEAPAAVEVASVETVPAEVDAVLA